MLRPELLRPPHYRNPDPDEHRASTWLELFYDLVFVVAVNQIATKLQGDPTWKGIAVAVALYIPVWWAWLGQTVLLSRFDSDDLVGRVITMAMMFFVGAMAVYVPRALEPGGWPFVGAYCIVRLLLIAGYLRAGFHEPRVRELTSRYASGFGLAICVWLASLAVTPAWRPIVWYAAVLIDYATPFAAGRVSRRFPPHPRHLPERLGLFTIVVLGETVLNVTNGLGSAGLQPAALGTAAAGWVIACGIWWCYYCGAEGTKARVLADETSARLFRIWLYIHMPFSASIVGIGVAVRMAIQNFGVPFTPPMATLLVAASATAMACVTVIAACRPGAIWNRARLRRFAPYFAVTAATILATGLAAYSAPAWVPVAIAGMGWATQAGISMLRVTRGRSYAPAAADTAPSST